MAIGRIGGGMMTSKASGTVWNREPYCSTPEERSRVDKIIKEFIRDVESIPPDADDYYDHEFPDDVSFDEEVKLQKEKLQKEKLQNEKVNDEVVIKDVKEDDEELKMLLNLL